MRLYSLSLFILLMQGCVYTSEASLSKEQTAQQAIKYNISESSKAKSDYIKLQKQRENE